MNALIKWWKSLGVCGHEWELEWPYRPVHTRTNVDGGKAGFVLRMVCKKCRKAQRTIRLANFQEARYIRSREKDGLEVTAERSLWRARSGQLLTAARKIQAYAHDGECFCQNNGKPMCGTCRDIKELDLAIAAFDKQD